MPSVKIGGQELVDIVPREAERGLGEIVGSEAEKFRFFGDFIRHQRSARQLDHGANQVMNLFPFLFENFLGNAADDRAWFSISFTVAMSGIMTSGCVFTPSFSPQPPPRKWHAPASR